MIRRWTNIAVFLGIALVQHSVIADDDELQRSKLLQVKMWEGRKAILRGECEIEQTFDDPKIVTKCKSYLAFDAAASRWRWDCEASDNTTTKCVERDGICIFYDSNVRSVIKQRPPADGTKEWHHPLDPRMLGVAPYAELSDRVTLESLKKVFESQIHLTMTIVASGNTMVRLAENPNPEAKDAPAQEGLKNENEYEFLNELEIEKKTFNPVKLRCFFKKPKTDVYIPEATIQTQFEKKSEVYVPIRTEIKSTGFECVLSLKWKSVNEPVDIKQFEIAGMKLPVGTAIVDGFNDPPKLEGMVMP